jgi:hypothetical protein
VINRRNGWHKTTELWARETDIQLAQRLIFPGFES